MPVVFELVERAASADPASLAVVTDDEALTYGDLLARARAVAGSLLDSGITRFGIVDFEAPPCCPPGRGLARRSRSVRLPAGRGRRGGLARGALRP